MASIASPISSFSTSFSARLTGPNPGGAHSATSRVHCRPLRVSASACASTAERAPVAISAPSSLYEVLGIQTGATCQEIKAAYRRLARVLHPDVNNERDDTAIEFIKLHEAYETLSDPEKRADYDRSLFWWGRSTSSPFVMSATTVCTMAGGSPVAAASGFSGYTRRRWETDQCW